MSTAPGIDLPAPATGPSLVAIYQTTLLVYLVSLLYLYPYGIPVAPEVNLRPPDLLSLLTLALGGSVILLRGRVRIDRTVFAIIGLFVAMELVAPIVGAVGYRRPLDVVSALRMAMLWLPMLFLTMLVPPVRALNFERSLVRILAVSLWLNLVYAVMQIASTVGVVPRAALITSWLAPWSVDKNFDIVQGIRPAGFFANSTALSVFGIVSLCFFYARFVVSGSRQNLVYSLLAVGIVVLTTSRTAYAATALILFAGWWHLPRGRQIAFAAIALTGAAALLVLIDKTIGLDVAFSRFERLADAGLLEDVSFGARVYDTWPTALAAARDYRFGTLIQAPRALPLIDSGYLTYYLQGKWLFVAAVLVLLAGQWLLGLRAFFGPRSQRLGLMTLFLAIFLTGALIISNPLRSPLVITFVVFSLWRLTVERNSAVLRALPADVNAPADDTAGGSAAARQPTERAKMVAHRRAPSED